LEAREDLLIGAYLAAATFASAGSGLHHKICHVLGGMYDLPHAATHAVVLPHVLGFNAPNDTDAAQRVARALGDGGPLESLDHLYAEVGAPRSLHALGLSRHDLEPVVPAVLRAAPPSNPTPVTAEGIEELLTAAWVGDGSRITQEVTA
jgi:alcohol dehydrogenase class IV